MALGRKKLQMGTGAGPAGKEATPISNNRTASFVDQLQPYGSLGEKGGAFTKGDGRGGAPAKGGQTP